MLTRRIFLSSPNLSILTLLLSGIEFGTVAAAPYSKGDVDGDEQVTRADAELVAKIISHRLTPNTQEQFAADLNSDGQVDALDLAGIVNLTLKKPLRGQVYLPQGSGVNVAV